MKKHKNPYTLKELTVIRKNLGKDGIERVCELLGKKVETVRIVLTEPRRYQEGVFEAVAIALEEKQVRLQNQKNRINQAIAI